MAFVVAVVLHIARAERVRARVADTCTGLRDVRRSIAARLIHSGNVIPVSHDVS
jgi:hypothetical protein